MTYQAWTAKAVELRVVEAAETLMLTPNTYGSSSAWPQIVRSADEATDTAHPGTSAGLQPARSIA